MEVSNGNVLQGFRRPWRKLASVAGMPAPAPETTPIPAIQIGDRDMPGIVAYFVALASTYGARVSIERKTSRPFCMALAFNPY